MKKYKTIGVVIGVLLVAIAFSVITIQQTAFAEPDIKVTRFGIIEKRSFTQEIFNTDKPGTCKLDDQRLTACAATQNYDSKPGEGTFHYWVDGWKELQSCAGFLSYYGCYKTFTAGNCEILNSGTCSGSAADSNAVECAVDTDCNSAPNQYCYGGKCLTSTENECAGGVYKCNSGSVYRCGLDNQYHWYGECTYFAAKTNDCTADGVINADPRVLCKNDVEAPQYEIQLAEAGENGWTAGDILCQKDVDCKSEASCQNGLCTPNIFLPDGRQVEMKQSRMLDELPKEGDACESDYNFKCPGTGELITPAKCVDKQFKLTGEKCQSTSEVGLFEVLWQNYSSWIIAGLVGLALIAAMLITK